MPADSSRWSRHCRAVWAPGDCATGGAAHADEHVRRSAHGHVAVHRWPPICDEPMRRRRRLLTAPIGFLSEQAFLACQARGRTSRSCPG